jgi:putative ABC transport system permease protein
MFDSTRVAVRRIGLEKRRSAFAIASMAVGIGAATTAFGVLDAVLLQPLPYRDQDSLVAIVSESPQRGIADANVSMGDFVYWREHSRSLHQVSALGTAELVLTGSGEPERLPTAAVSWNFLSALGVQPLLGRNFLPEEETPGRDQVVLLDYGLWRRRFGGDPSIVGKTLTLSGYSFEVVGVLPSDFVSFGLPADLWSPMAIDPDNIVRQRRGIRVIGRLRPGGTLRECQEEIQLLSSRLEHQFPATNAGWKSIVVPLKQRVVGKSESTVLIVFAAAVAVLLLAAGNLANLLLASSFARRAEVFVRQALGARPRDLIKSQLAENLLLAAIGCGAGLILANASLQGITAHAAWNIPRLINAHLSPRALAFALASSVGIAAALSLLPALFVKRDSIRAMSSLRNRGATSAERSAEAVVVAEVALAFLLLSGSAVLARSFRGLVEHNPGFRAQNVVVLNLALPLNKYPDGERQQAFFDRLIEHIQNLPAVTSAAASSNVPTNRAALNLDVPVRPLAPDGSTSRDERAALRLVTPNYFATLGIEQKEGRDLSDLDTASARRVAVVNSELAQRLWPRERAVGKAIRLTFEGEGDYEVVGVVSNVRTSPQSHQSMPEVFLSSRQHPQSFASIVVRVRNRPMSTLGALKGAVWSLDRDQDLSLAVLEQLAAAERAPQRFVLTLLLILTAVALLIACLGIFSVVSSSVERRSFEIAIRRALGAPGQSLVANLASRMIGVATVGFGVGLLLATLAVSLLKGTLVGVESLDSGSIATALVLLAGAVVAGCYLPTRRALRIDPMTALRKV